MKTIFMENEWTEVERVFSNVGLVSVSAPQDAVKLISILSYGWASSPKAFDNTMPPSVVREDADIVTRIWSTVLERNGLTFYLNVLYPVYEDSEKMEGLLEVGRFLGIDGCMELFFSGGIPLEDVLA